MLHAVGDLFEKLVGGPELGIAFLEEINALAEDLSSYLVAFILVFHKLITQQRRQVLEIVSFDPRQVKKRGVINAPNCGCAPALKQVTNLSKDTTRVDFAYIILSACKVCASDATLALTQEE